MKVILLKDVAKVGRRHEVKEVAAGFGRNFIIARGLGVLATPPNLRRLETWRAAAKTENLVQAELREKTLAGLADKVLTLGAKANEQGHLFAALHAADIKQALAEQFHLVIKEDWLDLPEPIKSLGEHQVAIRQTTDGPKVSFTVRAERLE